MILFTDVDPSTQGHRNGGGQGDTFPTVKFHKEPRKSSPGRQK